MYEISLLPPEMDIETKAVLKKTTIAHRYLAELKGVSESIPNERILIDTLVPITIFRKFKLLLNITEPASANRLARSC